MSSYRRTYMIARAVLLPFLILFALTWMKAHQPEATTPMPPIHVDTHGVMR